MENQGQEGPIKEWWEDRFRRRRNRKRNRNNNNARKSQERQSNCQKGKPNCKRNANKRY